MDAFRHWLGDNGYDWDDPKLSLGYIKLGQIDIQRTFGPNTNIIDIHEKMNSNLNITSMRTIGKTIINCPYSYALDGDGWKDIQIQGLKKGYESRSMR